MAVLTYKFEMYNDIHLSSTVRSKKITSGNASFTPEDDQDIKSNRKEIMTVAAGSTSETGFSGSFEIEVDGKRTFECKFSFSKEDGASFSPKEVSSDTAGYKIKYDDPTWNPSVAEVKFHIIYKQ